MGPKTWMNSIKLAEANVKASLLKKKSWIYRHKTQLDTYNKEVHPSIPHLTKKKAKEFELGETPWWKERIWLVLGIGKKRILRS